VSATGAGTGVRRPPLLLLALASSLSPFGMAVVLPAVAAIGLRFDADYAAVQFVLSAYLVGLGVTQPFSGILCDRLGRRPVLIGGAALFLVASVGCSLAPSLPVLVGFRLLQAVGISVGTVASRAMIRDTHDVLEMPRALARLAAAMGVAPVIAPIIGGSVGALAGPPGIFAVTALLGAVVLGWIAWDLDETRPASAAAESAAGMLHAWRELLASPGFVGHTLLYGFMQGAFFAFLAVGAAVFERDLGIDQRGFGLIWGGVGVAYIVSAVLAGRLIARFGLQRVLRAGAALAFAGGLAALAATLAFGVTRAGLLLPLLVMMTANGLVTPVALAGAVGGRPAIAGTAAGLSSAVGLVMTGAYSVVAGFVYTGEFLPIALLMATATGCTVLLLPVAARERWRSARAPG
jgi:DHA1 family bicyclomycin/chloramphenicol resistance-like MFS transporter